MAARPDLKSDLVCEGLVSRLLPTEGHIKALLNSANVVVQHRMAVSHVYSCQAGISFSVSLAILGPGKIGFQVQVWRYLSTQHRGLLHGAVPYMRSLKRWTSSRILYSSTVSQPESQMSSFFFFLLYMGIDKNDLLYLLPDLFARICVLLVFKQRTKSVLEAN